MRHFQWILQSLVKTENRGKIEFLDFPAHSLRLDNQTQHAASGADDSTEICGIEEFHCALVLCSEGNYGRAQHFQCVLRIHQAAVRKIAENANHRRTADIRRCQRSRHHLHITGNIPRRIHTNQRTRMFPKADTRNRTEGEGQKFMC